MTEENNANSLPQVSEPAKPSAKEAEEQKERKTAKSIIRLCESAGIRLFHSPAREAFVSFYSKGHWENCRVKSPAFREWLSGLCYHQGEFVPGQNPLSEAINLLAGDALFARPEIPVWTRVAEHNGEIYVDLGSGTWSAVRITPDGWQVVSDPPVRFVRAPDMLALPEPESGGSVGLVRPLLNLGNDDHWRLAVGWLVGSLRPKGPYPPLVIEGTFGSAKSAASRLLGSLVDPHTAPLRGAPRDSRDLAVSAENAWCLRFDNLSSVPTWFSDDLCRLSTGGGFATRRLYTNSEEKVFEGCRPVLLNGIEVGISREDLRDRGIFLLLPAIDDKNRLTDAEVSARFKEVQAWVLGGLYDAVACALHRFSEVTLSKKPRMADFVTWVSAAEPALGWSNSSFYDVYMRNRDESNAVALDDSPLYPRILWLTDQGPWEGTSTELLEQIELAGLEITPPTNEPSLPLPKTPKELSEAIRRLTPNLGEVGIKVEFARTPGSNSKRIIKVEKLDATAEQVVCEESAKE